MTEPRRFTLRRCPKCGAITERSEHCFIAGHPSFPQTDRSTTTEPVEVVEASALTACEERLKKADKLLDLILDADIGSRSDGALVGIGQWFQIVGKAREIRGGT